MPKIVDHDARRAAILDACFELFARRGIGAVTMRQIATAAGLSTGAIYHYFPDKESIARSLFHRVAEQQVAEAVASLGEGAPPAQKLAALLEFVGRREQRLRGILHIALDHHRHHPDDRDVLAGALGTYRAAIAEQLALPEAGREAVILSLLIGALVQRTLDPQGFELEQHLAALVGLLGSAPA